MVIGACDTIPIRGDRGQTTGRPTEPPGGVEVIPLEDAELETDFDLDDAPRDPKAAIAADLRQALDSPAPYRQTAYLDAARKLIDTHAAADAEKVLAGVDTSGLSPAVAARERLLRAEIFFERNDLDRALRTVDSGLQTPNVDPAHVAGGLDLKARIELRQGRPLEAAEAWIQRDRYLTDDRALAANHERIWYALGHLGALELQAAGASGDSELRGWLDLAILSLELAGDGHGLRTAVGQWIDANRGHPAVSFAGELLGPPRAPDVRQVALLLPLSSTFGAAAQEVYNGFDAANQTDTDPGQPRTVFYDVGAEPSLAANYYGAATVEGADVVVGPLGKAAVNALLSTRRPDRPIVLLGSSSMNGPLDSGILQFDLAPEPEAEQVADFMYASGHRQAAALHPDDEWGRRVYGAFAERWEALGGTLVAAQSYAPSSDDFTVPLKRLFNLTDSETRKAYLESRSGLSLEFEPRRRRDIDALFLVARPDEARQLKPQINFYQGHDLPVYSTSHVYTGTPDPIKDTDLDGIMFPDMSWLLRDTARVKKLKGSLRNAGYPDVSTELFAFGYDAYQLALLAADPGLSVNTRIKGLSSDLVIGPDGRVHRRLDWAKFNEGVPARIWSR